MTLVEAIVWFLIVGVAFFYLLIIFGPPVDRLLSGLLEWFRRTIY